MKLPTRSWRTMTLTAYCGTCGLFMGSMGLTGLALFICLYFCCWMLARE